jgi:hypothetical protein
VFSDGGRGEPADTPYYGGTELLEELGDQLGALRLLTF